MLRVGPYVFKHAETAAEFEQIHRLNHRTFVREIVQHPDNGADALIDKFHTKNVYFIVARDNHVIGMVSAHDQPPFSVTDRLTDPTILTREGTRPLEVRLLALEPGERNSTLFFGLVWTLYEYATARNYTHLFISGIEERQDLYERLGFVPLGPRVKSGNAWFVPMALTIGQLPFRIERVKKLWETHLAHHGESKRDRAARNVCLLPGPVTMSDAVQKAFHQPPIYHRGSEFIARFVAVRQRLSTLVGGREVAILNGSGTLGNEAMLAALATESQSGPGRGIVLINGEFGSRLARQATRFGLQPRILSWEWGQPWALAEVEDQLRQEPPGSWILGVHQESSTGVLNDLTGLIRLASRYGIRVCVDCISSLGAVPLDLREVYLATGTSGKSLGSFAGASLLFADPAAVARLDSTRVPTYLDIAAAFQNQGPCFTFPSPLLLALEAALDEYATPEKAAAVYRRYHELGDNVRQRLRALGLPPLAVTAPSPVITTFAPPDNMTTAQFVARCRRWGYAIGGESGYLAQQRFVQIATMGAVAWPSVEPLFDHLEKWLAARDTLAIV